MTSAEFSMWVALCQDDPWDEHVDLGFGQVCAAIANYAGKVLKSGVPPARAYDFMPLPEPVVAEPDPLEFFGSR